MAHKFYLERRTDFSMGCHEHIYSAVPCIGVFESEDSFIHYLRCYHAPKYGNCFYLGIKGEKERTAETILEIHQMKMNYEVATKFSSPQKRFTADDLQIGTAAIIVAPVQIADQLVIMCANGDLRPFRRLQCIDDPKEFWTNELVLKTIEVRLLEPGEVYEIRGK